MQQAELYRYGTTAAIVMVIMALRLRNVGKMRRMRLETLWIVPAIYLAMTAAIFFARPPAGVIWAIIAGAAIAGAAVGWQRGKMMHIEVDPETHTLNQRTSLAALGFIVAIILVRNLAGALAGREGLHVDVFTITDVAMGFALGMFVTQRVEMFLRAKRLLEEARAAAPLRS